MAASPFSKYNDISGKVDTRTVRLQLSFRSLLLKLPEQGRHSCSPLVSAETFQSRRNGWLAVHLLDVLSRTCSHQHVLTGFVLSFDSLESISVFLSILELWFHFGPISVYLKGDGISSQLQLDIDVGLPRVHGRGHFHPFNRPWLLPGGRGGWPRLVAPCCLAACSTFGTVPSSLCRYSQLSCRAQPRGVVEVRLSATTQGRTVGCIFHLPPPRSTSGCF